MLTEREIKVKVGVDFVDDAACGGCEGR